VAKLSNVIGVRLSDEDVRKLDRLAGRTYRGRADVLRCLLHQADALDTPDLIIGRITHTEVAVDGN
jgi:predicted transcriptional regulator